MKTEQLNLRLEPSLVEDLEAIADVESLDRGTVVRRLLLESIVRWKLDRALADYQKGSVSLGGAAEQAGVSLREMMAVRDEAGISQPFDPDLFNREMTNVRQLAAEMKAEGAHRGPSVNVVATPAATLADMPPREGGVLLVGINPAPPSVAAGHYYQSRLGRRLWKRLEALGLLDGAIPGKEDEAFARAGHGLTHLVKRPTKSAKQLTTKELTEGGQELREKIRSWRPGLILFAFKEPAVRLLGDRELAPGSGPEIEGVPTFLLSGPYASGADSDRVDVELSALLRSLAGGDERNERRKYVRDPSDEA